MNNEEIWKDLPNYKGIYQVSNLGNVKSLKRKVVGKLNSIRTLSEKKLTKNIIKSGYYTVAICKDGICKTKKVH